MKVPETNPELPTEWKCPECDDWNQVYTSGYDGRLRCPFCMSVVEGCDVETRPLQF